MNGHGFAKGDSSLFETAGDFRRDGAIWGQHPGAHTPALCTAWQPDDTPQSKGSRSDVSVTLNVLLRHGVRTVSANVPATESPSIASCSTQVFLERLPSLSNSCAVVTAHTHLKTNPFQMESYKLPQVFSSSSTLQAFFFYFIPGILEDWSA